MKILVIKLGALGDFVLAMAAMRKIREAHPDDHITLLTTPPFGPLVRNSLICSPSLSVAGRHAELHQYPVDTHSLGSKQHYSHVLTGCWHLDDPFGLIGLAHRFI